MPRRVAYDAYDVGWLASPVPVRSDAVPSVSWDGILQGQVDQLRQEV